MNTDGHPWIALLGWLPPIYLLGLVRHWGKPWCTWQSGSWIGGSCALPALWWPSRLYAHKREQQRRAQQRREQALAPRGR